MASPFASNVPTFLKPQNRGGGDASTPVGTNGASGASSASGGSALGGAIASQLLGIANDTGTHTTGHAATFTSHAADRAAATSRFSGYKKEALGAAKKAARTVMSRNPNIKLGYQHDAEDEMARANALSDKAQGQILDRNQAYAQTAGDLGLEQAFRPTESMEAQDALTGRSNAIAQTWAGFDRSQGRRAAERNKNTAYGIKSEGRAQASALNGLLENVLAGLQDTSTASTLGTANDVSLSQRMQALTGLRYLENDSNKFGLDQQKYLGSLTPKAPVVTTTKRGPVNRDGSSTTTTTRR